VNKMSPKERALLDVARKGWGPSPSVMRSVRAGVSARIRSEPTLGMDAPGPVDKTSSAWSFGRLIARSPWVMATGLAAVGLSAVVGVNAVTECSRPAPMAAPTSIAAPMAPAASPPTLPETAPAPEIGTVSLDSLPSAGPTASPKKTAAPLVGPRPSAAPASSHVDTLAEEIAIIRAAQHSLRDGSPAEALGSLSTHASRFPVGALREERMTLQVLALCALGDLPRARSVRAELERLAPASSHLQRLSCASQ
jgi:hypothetical protein